MHAPLLRQAAVMALFLTGMINDGAHAANGPGESRLYQTETEGRGVGGGGCCVGNRSLCTSVFEQGSVNYSELFPQAEPQRLTLGKNLTTRIDRYQSVINRENSEKTYLWTGVLNCQSWGPAPLRWLSVQTWPSVLSDWNSMWEIIQLQTKRPTVSGEAGPASPVQT